MRFFFMMLAFLLTFSAPSRAGETKEILNVSYDPTREFYADYNTLFAKLWKDQTGEEIEIKQSHGGSGKHPSLAERAAPVASGRYAARMDWIGFGVISGYNRDRSL